MQMTRQTEHKANHIILVYEGKLEEHRIKRDLTKRDIKSVLEEPKITFAAVNDNIIKGQEVDLWQRK